MYHVRKRRRFGAYGSRPNTRTEEPSQRDMTRAAQIWALVRSVAVGLFVGLLGTLSWAGLIAANLRHLPSVPWAVLAMVPILSVWWLYFAAGRGGPRGTQFQRKVAGRANRVPDDLWGPALGTGALGLFTTLLLQGVLARLVTLPQQQDLDPSKYPVLTMLAWVVMSALVAGVVEETAFRGYIQGGIERSHGLTTAVLLTGALFGFSHFAHPEVGIVLLPFYLAVAAVYGLLAAATDSVYPSMVLHAGGNLLSAFSLVSRGRSEWQLIATPPPTIWQSGADASFWANLVALLAFGAATVFAYRALFKAVRTYRLGQTSLL